jgi:hypothetical protein
VALSPTSNPGNAFSVPNGNGCVPICAICARPGKAGAAGSTGCDQERNAISQNDGKCRRAVMCCVPEWFAATNGFTPMGR